MNYIKNNKNFIKVTLILLAFLILSILLALGIGSVKINFIDVSKILLSNFFSNLEISNISTSSIIIINSIRLPRILLACIIGAALASSGSVYQGIFKNSMADPYILGISSGAALGASISILCFSGKYLSLSALIISLGITFFIYLLSNNFFRFSNTSLLLIGININYFLTSIISIMMIINKDKTEQILFWTMGSLSSASWYNVIICYLIIIPCIFLLSNLGKYLDAISCGDDFASTVGINTNFIRKIVIISVSLITAIAVSHSGIIGFEGLMIPHFCKLLFGNNHKYLVIISAIIGAIFLVICDTIARSVIAPTEIPIGIITSIIGAPYLIYLIIKNKKKGDLL